MSACATAASPRSARPAIPTSSPASTSSSAPAPKSSPAKGKILTAGGFDTHIHFICPQQIEEALMSGVTTMLGGGTGPAHGTFATTCTPGAVAHRPHDPGGRRLSDESRLLRQGQRVAPGRARGDGQGRRLRAQAARGLGHDARRDRLLPLGRRRLRRAGDDPHRHAQRDRASSRTPSRPSRAAPSTPSTPKARAAATRPTSSRSRGCRTSCRPPPIRRGRTRATPSTSISTC